MNIFTVHTRPWSADADAEATAVKEGFSWPAALLTFGWAFWHGMWLTALVVLAVEVGFGTLIVTIGLDPLSAAALDLGWSASIGFVANDLRRRSLARRGFVESAVIVAADRQTAEYRYFSTLVPPTAHT